MTTRRRRPAQLLKHHLPKTTAEVAALLGVERHELLIILRDSGLRLPMANDYYLWSPHHIEKIKPFVAKARC